MSVVAAGLNSNLHDDTNTSLDDLQRRMVVMESGFASSTGVLEVFSRLIPKAAEVISGFMPNFSAFQEETKQDTVIRNKDFRKTLTAVNKLPFHSFQDVMVVVPEGFHGPLDKYLKLLITTQSEVTQRAAEALAGYQTDLGSFLNNIEKSVKPAINKTPYMKIKSDRLKVQSDLGAYFKAGSNVSRAKLGMIITRFADLEGVFSKTEQLVQSKNGKQLNQLMQGTNQTVELLKLIKDKLDNDKEIVLSAEVAKGISEGAFEIAKYIELVALVTFNVETAIAVSAGIVEQFSRIQS